MAIRDDDEIANMLGPFQDELVKLSIFLSPRTVADALDRQGLTPAPERGTDSTWKTCITEHMHELAATDLLSADV